VNASPQPISRDAQPRQPKRAYSRWEKLAWSLPWLMRYPAWRIRELLRRAYDAEGPRRLILLVANHFEPGWNGTRAGLSLSEQLLRVEDWYRAARKTASLIKDPDGAPFRHTNFYPAEQYHRPLLDLLAQMQADELGEVEIHLHHGVDEPDDEQTLKTSLEEFRDVLATEHGCLSRRRDNGQLMYAFVHGNWALANSARGRFCGVDSEMQVLADTGCYADFTLPAIHSPAQVRQINSIYQCGHALDQAAPHRSGPALRVGRQPRLPIIFEGPTVFDWAHARRAGVAPCVDDGVLTASYPLDLNRLNNWQRARIGVRGRADWIFIKLYCHGFFRSDAEATIGETMRRFLANVLELSARNGEFTIHFATAREAFNIAMAAVDGFKGNPGQYRDYLLELNSDKQVRTMNHILTERLAEAEATRIRA